MTPSNGAREREERFLLRVTGKGVTFKRRIPGWLAAWLIRLAVENDPKEADRA
jgi:hypothetical protein